MATTVALPENAPHWASLLDLASARLGGLPLAASDDFFAEKENLLMPAPAEFKVGVYTDRGKWMDGWESRRNRDPRKDHDWVVLRLGLPGAVLGFDVDTSFFVGNAPEAVAIDLLSHPAPLRPHEAGEVASWVEVVPPTRVERGAHNFIAVHGDRQALVARATHARLRIFPDGGVARFRVYGEVVPDWERALPGQLVDLASMAWGGRALASNDAFFSPKDNINLPWASRRMDDGWETRRRRTYNAGLDRHDWILVQLGRPAAIRQAIIETHFFKGNPPDRACLEAVHAPGAGVDALTGPGMAWRRLLPMSPLEPHGTHTFDKELDDIGVVSHVRLTIEPDGGVSRLRLFGAPT
ncbi:MAG: allantoicase [Deltaproteobacteria bacterium]|nr:allantoicase [Deltaproteobacteria bacterium]